MGTYQLVNRFVREFGRAPAHLAVQGGSEARFVEVDESAHPDHRPFAFDSTEPSSPAYTRRRVEMHVCAWPYHVHPAMGVYGDALDPSPTLRFWDLPDALVVEVAPATLRAEWAAADQRAKEHAAEMVVKAVLLNERARIAVEQQGREKP